MRNSLFVTLLFFVNACLYAQKTMPLYEGTIPNSKQLAGLTDSTLIFGEGKTRMEFIIRVAKPELTSYLPEKSKATDIAVIICPGGGYSGLAIGHEGHDMAKRLQANGIAAFVLKYRLPNPAYVDNKEFVPLQDAQRAIQVVRENAQKWGINPSKIGIAGSSAGGHLASTAGTHYVKAQIANPKKTSLRPDFMILNYPVISFADSLTHHGSRFNLVGEVSAEERQRLNKDDQNFDTNVVPIAIAKDKIREYSNELHVNGQTPRTFITHAVDDTVVKVQNTVLFIAALQKNKVPVESFFYANGGHGYGMDNPTSTVDWMDSCLIWLLKMK